jgi:hypothetical protein
VKRIEVPEELWDSFLIFLDVAQSRFTKEEIADFPETEQRVIDFVDSLLMEHMKNALPSKKFETKAEKHAASKGLAQALERR